MAQQQAASGGIGLSGALFLVFLTLQLTDNIDWEWYWIASPFWVPFAIIGALLLTLAPIIFLIKKIL